MVLLRQRLGTMRLDRPWRLRYMQFRIPPACLAQRLVGLL